MVKWIVAFAFLIWPTELNKREPLVMSIEPKHFRELIIRPTLRLYAIDGVELLSPDSEELLMLTGAQETHLGRWLRQNGIDGNYAPGRGPYSMEPNTYYWLQSKFPTLLKGSADQLVWDLRLATLAARLRYWVVREALPSRHDWRAMAIYWDVYYNGNPNHGTPEEAVSNYKRYALGKG